jgi:hypothetical protein
MQCKATSLSNWGDSESSMENIQYSIVELRTYIAPAPGS